MGAGMSEGHKALFRIAIVLLKAHTTHLSKAVDHADAMDLLCPINPLATRVPINDNDMLTKAFKLSLARKQFSVSLPYPQPLRERRGSRKKRPFGHMSTF